MLGQEFILHEKYLTSEEMLTYKIFKTVKNDI